MLLNERLVSFGDFINESENNSAVKVVVLSGTAKPSKTSKQFVSVCQERGIECHIVDVNNSKISKLNKGHVIENTVT